MNDSRFKEYCQMGTHADLLFQQGRLPEAVAAYEKILQEIEQHKKEVNSYLLAKATLGLLLCHVRTGNFEKAFHVWNANMDENFCGVGIYALENAQTSIDDMLSYDLVCAFLHSISDQPKEHSARSINQYLSRVASHALEVADQKLFNLAINNWKLHLREVYQGTIPHEHAATLIRFEKKCKEPVRPQAVAFPKPAPWEKPEPFREMSRIAQAHTHAGRRRVG